MFFSILLFLGFIFFFVLAIKNLKWAVFLIVLVLPSYLIRFQVVELPSTALEAMIIILFGVWVVKKIKNKKVETQEYKNKIINCWQRDKNKVFLYFYIFIFLISATMAMFTGPELRAAAGLWKSYFVEPLLFLLVFISTIKKEHLKNVFVPLAASALVLSMVAIYQKITGDFIANDFWAAEATRRVTSVFEYPNALALYLTPIIVILFGITAIKPYSHLIINNKWFNGLTIKRLYLFIIIMGLLSVYFTRSKGALLGALAGLIFYAIFYRGYRKYYTTMLAVIFIFLFLFFYIFNITFNWRGQTTVAGGDSVTTRIEMWGEAWQMIKERPMSGAGLAGYQTAVAPYHKKEHIEIYLYPHNEFLNFWSETGILGLVSWLFIIGWFYKKGFKLLKDKSEGSDKSEGLDDLMAVSLMGGMTAMLIHGLVDVPYFKNDLSVFFWLLMGMMIVLSQKNIGENETNKV